MLVFIHLRVWTAQARLRPVYLPMEHAHQPNANKFNQQVNPQALPGITEFRYNQLQEIEAVLNYLNIQLRKIRRKHFQKYLEGYARALTSRDAEKYVDGEDEVIDYETLINEVAYLRNRWLGILKGLDTKQWQMGHVVRLRTAGMEDIQV